MKLQIFKVSGAGPFPFEMLSEEACWPHNVSDAKTLIGGGYRIIELKRFVSAKSDYPKDWPDVRRWQTFDWNVHQPETF